MRQCTWHVPTVQHVSCNLAFANVSLFKHFPTTCNISGIAIFCADAVESEPVITAGKHVTCVSQRPGVALTCSVGYSGSELMPLVMTWKSSTGLQLTDTTSNSSSMFMSSTCLLPSPSSSLSASSSSAVSYTCTISFSQPSAHTVFQGIRSEYYRQKPNAPSITVSTVYRSQPGQ